MGGHHFTLNRKQIIIEWKHCPSLDFKNQFFFAVQKLVFLKKIFHSNNRKKDKKKE
jgi:hypothetical protein